MSTEKKTPIKKSTPIKKKTPRKEDKSYILNPKTGSYIKRSGKIHKQLISDNIFNVSSELRKNTVLKRGTEDELKQFKQNLESANLTDDKHKLIITNGRLQRRRHKMSIKQVLNNSQNGAKNAIMANKFLLTENRLTDKQTDMILTRIIDSKIMGKDINLEKEIAIFCNLNELGIKSDVKKTESKIESKPELKSILKKPNRFRLRKPPPPVMTDTEVESEYPRSDDDSDSDSDFYK